MKNSSEEEETNQKTKRNKNATRKREAILRYPWPGNVRELKSALEYAFVVAEGDWIGRDHLPRQMFDGWTKGSGIAPSVFLPDPAEKEALVEALRASRGNQSAAARLLNISRVTVWNRMRKSGIEKGRFRTPGA